MYIPKLYFSFVRQLGVWTEVCSLILRLIAQQKKRSGAALRVLENLTSHFDFGSACVAV